jgi:hypothetical protein
MRQYDNEDGKKQDLVFHGGKDLSLNAKVRF